MFFELWKNTEREAAETGTVKPLHFADSTCKFGFSHTFTLLAPNVNAVCLGAFKSAEVSFSWGSFIWRQDIHLFIDFRRTIWNTNCILLKIRSYGFLLWLFRRFGWSRSHSGLLHHHGLTRHRSHHHWLACHGIHHTWLLHHHWLTRHWSHTWLLHHHGLTWHLSHARLHRHARISSLARIAHHHLLLLHHLRLLLLHL